MRSDRSLGARVSRVAAWRGVAMKKIRATEAAEPLNIRTSPKRRRARRGSDPTPMVMSVMAGIGMGVIGLLCTGQL